MIKKVLFAGNYDIEYNRTKIIEIGLKNIGIEIIHFTFKKHNSKTRHLIKELSQNVDLIFLPSFTHRDVKFTKKASVKPILFDPLISRYLTKVFDFKKVWRFSPRAYKNYLKDKIAFKYADRIISDTEGHKKYYHKQFKIPYEKIDVIPIGSDCSVFYPIKVNNNSTKFIVGFYGGFIPLQGVSNIINAAKILMPHSDIIFKLIGTGFEYDSIKKTVVENSISNVELLGWLDYNDLPNAINKCNVCLGIFGNTLKTELVIPNKIFHYAACEKPIITKETKSIKEIFKNNENIILTSSNPTDIADAILSVKNNTSYANKIAKSAYELVSTKYNTKSIAEKFIQIAHKMI